jgi:hypothetical protein
LSVAIRPSVSVLFNTPLGYLADHQVDISVIITNVQVALQNAINENAGPLSVTGLMAVVAGVPGVSLVPRVLLNGDIYDLPNAEYYVDVPAMVSAEVVIVE